MADARDRLGAGAGGSGGMGVTGGGDTVAGIADGFSMIQRLSRFVATVGGALAGAAAGLLRGIVKLLGTAFRAGRAVLRWRRNRRTDLGEDRGPGEERAAGQQPPRERMRLAAQRGNKVWQQLRTGFRDHFGQIKESWRQLGTGRRGRIGQLIGVLNGRLNSADESARKAANQAHGDPQGRAAREASIHNAYQRYRTSTETLYDRLRELQANPNGPGSSRKFKEIVQQHRKDQSTFQSSLERIRANAASHPTGNTAAQASPIQNRPDRPTNLHGRPLGTAVGERRQTRGNGRSTNPGHTEKRPTVYKPKDGKPAKPLS